jgi:uroporphyrinogen-III synthase
MKSSGQIIETLMGRQIAVPESRQLHVLAQLLMRRGAAVHRCPLLNIIDAPEAGPIRRWLNNFIDRPPDYFIAMTGEGIERLLGFADRFGIDKSSFTRALRCTTLISRGPKPARALRQLGLVPDLFAAQPTSTGVIDVLRDLPLQGCTVALQLYGDDPNELLTHYLRSRHATIETVAPYRYAAATSRAGIAQLISLLEKHRIDAIVFTSKAQVDHLYKVAAEIGALGSLTDGLKSTCVAAVGPIVRVALEHHECQINVEPDEQFFMKPLVTALGQKLGAAKYPSNRSLSIA